MLLTMGRMMGILKVIIIILLILDVIGYCLYKFRLDLKLLRSFEPKFRKMAEKSKLKHQKQKATNS